MKKNYAIIILSCAFLMMTGVLYSCSYDKGKEQDILLTTLDGQKAEEDFNKKDESLIKTNESNGQEDVQEKIKEQLIYVHLCGAVVNPNVYEAKAGSRLIDLIKLAGGLSLDAAGDYINQAMEVKDGQRIYIPTKDELKELSIADYVKGDQSDQSQGEQISDSKVNINTADETMLMSLPGIGQAKARSIIEYRNKNGDFKETSDLMNVAGIKEGLFTRLEDLITVGNKP